MSSSESDPEQVVRDCINWVNGDSTKVEVIAEDVDVDGPLETEDLNSREEWEENLSNLRDGFPDIHFAIEDLVVGDDTVVAEMTLTGTHEGSFMGIPPTGRRAEVEVMNKYTVADGQVVALRTYFDSRQIPEQLGLTFPAIIGQLPKLLWRKIAG